MWRAARLGRGVALGLLLTVHAVAAFEPITVGIAIGAASALTGYLSYKDIYCRFAECCREEQRLNASGRAGRPARGEALTLSWAGAGGTDGVLVRNPALEALLSDTHAPDRGDLPKFLKRPGFPASTVRRSESPAPSALHHVSPIK